MTLEYGTDISGDLGDHLKSRFGKCSLMKLIVTLPHIQGCAIYTHKIIGPYFFDEKSRQITISTIPDTWKWLKKLYFQNYGKKLRVSRLLNSGSSIDSSQRTFDIEKLWFQTAPDFLLWDYMKEKVYKDKSKIYNTSKEIFVLSFWE